MVDSHIVIYDRAEEIDQMQWSRLSSNLDVRLDQRWSALNEGDVSATIRYVSLWSEDDQLLALAPCAISNIGGSGFASYRLSDVLFTPEVIRGPDPTELDRSSLIEAEQFLRTQPLFPSLAVTILYSPYAPVSDLLYGSAATPQQLELLLEAIEKIAAEASAHLWGILGVPINSPLLAYANDHGFLSALVSADTKMQIPWHSFDGYLAALPSSQRSEARQKIARRRERGITIGSEPDPGNIVDDLVRISLAQHELHGHTTDMESERSYFREIIRLFGKDFHVVSARRRGEMIGFGALLSIGKAHKAFEYGVDYRMAERSDDIFPNIMYGVIQEVIRRGGGQFSFGPTNYKAKLLRGCSLEPVWGLYKPAVPSLRNALTEYLRHFNRVQSTCFEFLKTFEVSLRKTNL